MIFANARAFRDQIRHLAAAHPPPTWIVIAAEPITDVDTTAADVLEELDLELNENGISLIFAELKSPVREKIDRYRLTRTIDPNRFFATIEDAVAAYHVVLRVAPAPALSFALPPVRGVPGPACPARFARLCARFVHVGSGPVRSSGLPSGLPCRPVRAWLAARLVHPAARPVPAPAVPARACPRPACRA